MHTAEPVQSGYTLLDKWDKRMIDTTPSDDLECQSSQRTELPTGQYVRHSGPVQKQYVLVRCASCFNAEMDVFDKG